MDYESFKENFQDALKTELADRGIDAELTARKVEKINDSYDAITVRSVDSAVGVNVNTEKAFAAYEKGVEIKDVVEHMADGVENSLLESPQFDLDAFNDYDQMKSKLSMEVVSAERNAAFLKMYLMKRWRIWQLSIVLF